jgi:YD repeat-containing protein
MKWERFEGLRLGVASASLAAIVGSGAHAAEVTAYRYDALGRLVATTSDAGPSSTLGYDPAGNRTQYTVTTGGGGNGGAVIAIVNGSFEEPPLQSGWQFGPTLTGVTFAGRAGVQRNGSAWAFADAPEGSQTGVLQGFQGAGGSISFSVSDLVPGAAYKVRFWSARRSIFGVATILVDFNNSPLGSYAPASTAFAQVTTTAAFVPAATSGTVTFKVDGTADDTSAAIDGVALVQVAPPAPVVPDSSFEQPTTAGWTYNPQAAGLVFTGRAGVQANQSAWHFANAPDGSQTGMLQGYQGAGGSIEFSVTGLTAGTTYRIRFLSARRPENGVATLNVAFNGASLGAGYAPVSTAFASVTTPGFVASANGGTLKFSVAGTSDDTSAAIDQIVVEPMP